MHWECPEKQYKIHYPLWTTLGCLGRDTPLCPEYQIPPEYCLISVPSSSWNLSPGTLRYSAQGHCTLSGCLLLVATMNFGACLATGFESIPLNLTLHIFILTRITPGILGWSLGAFSLILVTNSPLSGSKPEEVELSLLFFVFIWCIQQFHKQWSKQTSGRKLKELLGRSKGNIYSLSLQVNNRKFFRLQVLSQRFWISRS